MFVGITSIKEPGALGFNKPQTKISRTVPIVDIIPNNDMFDNTLNGKKTGGVTIKNPNILKKVTEYSGNNAFNESPNNISNETPQPNKSNVNKHDINKRPFGPNAAKPRSAQDINVGSVSKHLDNNSALQNVPLAKMVNNNKPKIQPACFKPNGKANKPNPINTLIELKIVCGAVD